MKPWMRYGIGWHFFEETDKGGGGGSTNPPTSDKSKESRKPTLQSVMERFDGDSTRMATHIAKIENENYDLRGAKRDLNEEVDHLKEKQKANTAPGSITLTKEEAAAWEEYKKLGEPKDLKVLSQKNTELETQIAKDARAKTLTDVSAKMGYDAAVFEDLDSRIPGLEYFEKEITLEGETQAKKVVYVKQTEEENGKQKVQEKPLQAFMEEKWSKYLPSLLVNVVKSNGNLRLQNSTNNGGVPFPSQPPGGAPTNPANSGGIASNYMQNRYARKQPSNGDGSTQK